MAVIKDLGAVTAYAAAVEGGYTGTKAEFETLMASYASVAEEAAESAESAQASATTASSAASTATTKASEATTAAQTATAKAEEAQADADAAALDASQALSAASTATTKASEAAQSASDAVTAKTAAQTAQTAAEGSATTAQTAAQTATQKAAEAAESARTLTIDSTLTQSGQAADSKVVGDEITSLKEDLNITHPDSSDDWSVGLINSTTGANTTATKILRTSRRDIESVKALSTQSGYTFLVFGYKVEEDTATFLGWWKNGAFYVGTGATSYYVSSLDFSPLKETEVTHYRVCLKRTDDAVIDVSESINLLKTVSVTAENKKRLDSLETSVTAMTPIVQDMETIPDAFRALAQTQESVAYVDGKYINTSVSVGTVVDVENPVVASTLCYAMCPCKAGDGFTLTGSTSGLTNPRTWAFVDTEYKLLSKATQGLVAENLQLTAETDGYIICDAYKGQTHSLVHRYYYEGIGNAINDLQEQIDNIDTSNFSNDALTALFSAQRYISEDWHFAFINVSQGMGLGRNHVVPATKNLWSQSATADLNQCGIWMSDAVHPFKGDGVTDMYARTIASQFAMVVPSYRNGVGSTTPSVWSGRNILWMGTSIPAGSDPDAGEGTGSTYPALVASLLGATAVNKSKGSSCVRINASTGGYTGMIFNHFARALTRTLAECDAIATDWDNIKGKISGAPSTLSEANINTMKAHSFENLLLPYLDGTNTMPDLFVIDHGHNDVRPKGIDGKTDLWLTPSTSAIESGILAEDTYMVADDYANLKTALNDDLSGISDLASFSASINRNCFKGAVNFLITLILRYNPYARIVIVSDYN